MIEIERRFLCRLRTPELLEGVPVHHIEQGYLTNGSPAVRIRRRDGEYLLTVKAGQGRVRREVEFPVPPGAGAELLELAGEHRVEKLRYEIGRWELDCFQGKLAGLIMAEVELIAEDEPLPPVPAGLDLIREVTTIREYTNQCLAQLGAEESGRLVEEVLRLA
jgi:CYTH domain-containing protein